MALTAAVSSRLEKKDKMIANLREKIATLKAKVKEKRALRVIGGSQSGDTPSKRRRPATSKARPRARARSANKGQAQASA